MSVCVPPAFILVTKPACCSACNNTDQLDLMNRRFTPNRIWLCTTCFVKQCPAHWKRKLPDNCKAHDMLSRDFCQLTKAPYRHVDLCMFFVPLLKENDDGSLLQSSCWKYYCDKQQAMCLYEFAQETRNWSDFFVSHACVEGNVKKDIEPFFKIKRRLWE